MSTLGFNRDSPLIYFTVEAMQQALAGIQS